MSDPRVVAVIPKNSLEEVRVSLSEFNGHPLIDIRTFADFDRAAGEKRPTKKGISLNRSKIGELIEALRRAEAEG